MYAKNANELRALILKNPEDLPSSFIMDSSFAAHCYDKLTLRNLKSAFHRDADPDECSAWNISRVEWKENIEMAYVAKAATAMRHKA
ncbi:MAG: hypothetical protein KKD44_16930 [Proteobacteria bacterium]|nr:hypothetical protein [Pseudomonadota bacterium]